MDIHEKDIEGWRSHIDQLDEKIVDLINERAAAARAIGLLKQQQHLPVYEPNREETVFAHVRACNNGPLEHTEILHIYERLIDVMRTLQKKTDA